MMTGHTMLRVTAQTLIALCAVVSTAQAGMPAAGSVAPDFTLRSSLGKNQKLSEYRGRVVMINFWATWCAPCRQELPLLNHLYEQYHKSGFTLLGVNIDDNPEAAKALAQKLGVTFPVLFDTDKQVSHRYDVDAMPSSVLIDRSGKVRYLHRGYRSGVEAQYDQQVRELLKQ
jgi:peroxiredoxin